MPHKNKLILLGIALLGLFSVALAFKGWHQPIIDDRSFHIYSAQEIARGKIPYVDFFNIHPPLAIMLMALPMWLFPSLLTGAGPSTVHSILTIIWSAGSVVAIYYIAERMSGKKAAGLLAAFIWVALTPLFLRHFSVGQNRLLVTTAILLTVLFLQNRRWYWAGFALSVGFMTYYPTIIGAVAFAALIMGKAREERMKTLVQFAKGFLTVFGAVSIWLMMRGAFIPWIKVTLLWPFQIFSGGSAGQEAILLSELPQQIVRLMTQVYQIWDVSLVWIPIFAFIAFIHFTVYAIKKHKDLRTFSAAADSSPVFFSTIVFLLYIFIETRNLDSMMLQPLLAIWISWEIAFLYSFLSSRSKLGSTIFNYTVAILLLVQSFIVVGTYKTLFDAGLHRNWRSGPPESEMTVFSQIDAAGLLNSRVGDEKEIMVLGDLWFLNVTGRENPSLFYHTGEKMRLSADLAGYAEGKNDIFNQIAKTDADIYIISEFRGGGDTKILTELLADNRHVCTGNSGNVFTIIRRDDLDSLLGVLAMHQYLDPVYRINPAWKDMVVDLEDFAGVQDIDIREIAPGIILLKDEIQADDPANLTLYWWSWAKRRNQPRIKLSVETPEGVVYSEVVNQTSFSEHIIIKQSFPLDSFGGLTDNMEIKLSSDINRDPRRFTCKSDFTNRNVVLELIQ